MKETHLQLDRLAVGYNGRALIHGIEIGVRRGEIVVLIGPNGSGKSTILKTITRQLVPVSGQIRLASVDGDKAPVTTGPAGRGKSPAEADPADCGKTPVTAGPAGRGKSPAGLGPGESKEYDSGRSGGPDLRILEEYSASELARQMAVVLTGRLQTELLTCRDVASMGRYPYTGRLGILSEEDEKKVEEAIAAVHAEKIADRPFDAVSDGERQRILLARAIAQEPEIIVLDEPTSYLDIRHKLELLGILRRMSRTQGITVVMSLHEIDLALRIADRVICVKGEKIFAVGAPEEVLNEETVRRLYDLTPDIGTYDPQTGRIELP